MQSFPVADDSHVAEARRGLVAMATGIGFDAVEAGRVAIVATELATNLLKHGSGGELLGGTFDDETESGLECLALDRGPGIPDVAEALRDGYSSAGSAGTGLGAVRRQSHAFEVFSRPGNGTAILSRLQRGRPPVNAVAPHSRHGAVNVPMRGETVCGDAWSIRRSERGTMLFVVDGLGHGPMAATAALAGVRCFQSAAALSPGEMLQRIHSALRPTRGAAGSIAEVQTGAGTVVFAGVGNVTGTVVGRDGSRRMVTHNGTLGHSVRRFQEFPYPAVSGALVVLASDGLGTSWSLDAYPGLRDRHPTLIAGVLYRDFARGRDDVTVLVWGDVPG